MNKLKFNIEKAEERKITEISNPGCSASALDVMERTIEAGEARILRTRGGLYVIYDDPHFGEKIDTIHLGYNSEIGLHVRDEIDEDDVRTLFRRLDEWQQLARMTILGEHSGNKTDYLVPWMALLDAYLDTRGAVMKHIKDRAGTLFYQTNIDIAFNTIAGIFQLLPEIISPLDIYTHADAEYEV